MKKRKKIVILSIFALVLGLASTSVNAAQATAGFDSNTNYIFRDIYTDFYKTDSSNAIINWNTSSQAGAHNMWFRITNSSGQAKYTSLFSYLENREFSTSTGTGYRYNLQARRENSVDPVTRISGNWRA